MRNYEVELALLLNKLNNQKELSASYLAKCQLLLDPEFERLFTIADQHLVSEQSFKNFLEEAELPAQRINELGEIYQKITSQKQMQSLLMALEEFLRWEPQNKDRSKVYRASKEFQNELEKHPPGYLKKLGEVLLAIKIDNESWALNKLVEFFNMHPARLGFDLYRQVFTQQWDQDRHDKLILGIGIEITKYFKKKYPEEMDIFMTSLKQSGDSRVFSSLSQAFGTDWSLARLRESVEKGQRARQYPSFWFSQLSYRTSSGQIDQFLRDLFINTKRYPLSPEALWIFAENFPRLENEREHLVEVSIKGEQEDFYYRYLVLQLLEHGAFKKLIESKNQKFSRPLFQLKRQSLRQGLKNLRAPEWMLFELLKLGDYQKDYLWYIGLHPDSQKTFGPQKNPEI